jgi:hypothetical protein
MNSIQFYKAQGSLAVVLTSLVFISVEHISAREGSGCAESIRDAKRQAILDRSIEEARRTIGKLLNIPYAMTNALHVAGSPKTLFWIYATNEYASVHETEGYLMHFDSKGKLLERIATFNYEIPLNRAPHTPRIPKPDLLLYQFLGWNFASSLFLFDEAVLPTRLRPPAIAIPVDAYTSDPEVLFKQLEDVSATLNLYEFNLSKFRGGLEMAFTVKRVITPRQQDRVRKMNVSFEKRRGVMIISNIDFDGESSRDPELGVSGERLILTKKQFNQLMTNIVDNSVLALKSYGPSLPDGSPGDPLARVYKSEIYTDEPGKRVYTLLGYPDRPKPHGQMMTLGRVSIEYQVDFNGRPIYPLIKKVSFWRAPSEILE